MNEDFTEEEFEDELPAGVEFAEPVDPIPKSKAPRAPVPRPVQTAPVPQPRGRPRTAPVAAAEVPMVRFSPYIVPKSAGVVDNEIGKPLMEDTDTNTLILALITKLLNDVDDIKKNL